MARLPYTNFHDINLDWLIKRVMPAYTPDNPPPYPVKSVNGKTGSVLLTGGDIPFSEEHQNVTVLDFCDFALERFENIQIDLGSKQDAPVLAGSPGDVLSLDADQNPVWSTPAAPTDDYNDLQNKPQINGVTVSGNKTGADFGLLNAALARMMYAPIITDTASGDPANFPDGIADMPMEVLASIEPVQDLHGYANPWPGGGGKNLFDDTKKVLNGNNVIIGTDSITGVSCTLTAGTYTISVEVTNDANTNIYAIDTNTNSNITGFPAYNAKNKTFTLASDTSIRFYVYDVSATSVDYVIHAQVEAGSTFTDYAPYSNICPISGNAGMTLYKSGSDTSNPDVYLFAWGDIAGTVYGGTVEVKADGSCKLKAEWARIEYDGSIDENWGTYAEPTDPTFCCVIYPPGKKIGYQTSICNEFKNVNAAFSNSAYGIYCDHPSLINVYFRMPNASVTTLAEFRAWIAQNPIQLVYELENPIVYDLPSIEQIKSLFGDNNVWTDVGPVTVDYYADTKLFILKVI